MFTTLLMWACKMSLQSPYPLDSTERKAIDATYADPAKLEKARAETERICKPSANPAYGMWGSMMAIYINRAAIVAFMVAN